MTSESASESASCRDEYVARVLKGWPSNIALESGSAVS
jgi:hypothetical protein